MCVCLCVVIETGGGLAAVAGQLGIGYVYDPVSKEFRVVEEGGGREEGAGGGGGGEGEKGGGGGEGNGEDVKESEAE